MANTNKLHEYYETLFDKEKILKDLKKQEFEMIQYNTSGTSASSWSDQKYIVYRNENGEWTYCDKSKGYWRILETECRRSIDENYIIREILKKRTKFWQVTKAEFENVFEKDILDSSAEAHVNKKIKLGVIFKNPFNDEKVFEIVEVKCNQIREDYIVSEAEYAIARDHIEFIESNYKKELSMCFSAFRKELSSVLERDNVYLKKCYWYNHSSAIVIKADAFVINECVQIKEELFTLDKYSLAMKKDFSENVKSACSSIKRKISKMIDEKLKIQNVYNVGYLANIGNSEFVPNPKPILTQIII